jgi:hypothetical protein
MGSNASHVGNDGKPGEMPQMVHRLRGVGIAALVLLTASKAFAMCGCDKPPPPRASVRPFVAHAEQTITLFDDRFQERKQYTVVFTARDGSSDWSQARGVARKDFADGVVRRQLKVAVPNVGLGPSAISVFDRDGVLLYSLTDDQFTVIAQPIPLHDFAETITRDGFKTGVSTDGTMYVAFDATEMSNATTYTGLATGLGMRFRSDNVLIYNAQGFFGGWLDPQQAGLFQISPGSSGVSDTLSYWRHEFATYKDQHRKLDARRTADGEWHADGTPHVDNFHFVVAISATTDDGQPLPAGATPAFQLSITSRPAPVSDL